MRFLGGLIVFLLAVLAFRWGAGELGLQLFGRETRARVSSVSKSSGSRTRSYTAHYEFVTENLSKGYGTCPSHQGAEGAGVTVRYFRHDPDWSTPTIWWYAGFWILVGSAVAWPLALWSARILLYQRVRRFGDNEEEEDEEDDEDEAEQDENAAVEGSEPEAAKAPSAAGDVAPLPFRNRWSAAILFSLALSAVAFVANLAWFDAREKSASAALAAAIPTSPAAAPASTAALTRGATAGNVLNGSLLGFDGEVLYLGLWRDYDNPASPAPGLYRFNLDGSGRTLVGPPGETARIYRGVQVKDDWIYYLSMDGIARIRKDGTKHRLLTKNRAASMAVVGDWIYYQFEVLGNAIHRMKLDGGSEAALCREATDAMGVTDDGWIYYTNKLDAGRIWRMKGDGSARSRLADRTAAQLLVAGGAIWFTDPAKNHALCRLNLDGTGGETVIAESGFSLNWIDGRIYFVRREGQLIRCKPDGTELETVAPKAVGVLAHGNYLFIPTSFESKAVIRTTLTGAGPRKLTF
jgi:hypothetical protein